MMDAGGGDPGEGLIVRALTVDDRALMAQLPERISPASATSRFHTAMSDLPASVLDQLLDLEPGVREALLALDDEGIVGVARFARDAPGSDTAEVAVVVADAWQHRGVGRLLLHRLTTQAVAAGITRFRADMLAENLGARRLFGALAPVLDERRREGHLVMTLDLSGARQR